MSCRVIRRAVEMILSVYQGLCDIFWRIEMAGITNDRAFVEEEDCDWP